MHLPFSSASAVVFMILNIVNNDIRINKLNFSLVHFAISTSSLTVSFVPRVHSHEGLSSSVLTLDGTVENELLWLGAFLSGSLKHDNEL